jgi:uncharacterized membrane protein
MACEGCKWSMVSTTLMCEDKDKLESFLLAHGVLKVSTIIYKIRKILMQKPDV